MKWWEEVEKVNVSDKEKYVEIFKEVIKKVKNNQEIFPSDEFKIIRTKIKNEDTVHVVPSEIYNLFNEIRKQAPNEFLGFSVKINNLRVCLFGIPCNEAGKAIIK
jgi:PP-loop superfamily ATP-utilizing enzyme